MRLITLILVTMKRFLFLVLASCVVTMAQAQRVYFMYLQSENAAPFFVKMGDKVYSSTGAGYVILSSLKDSTYAFSVGFPGAKATETRFNVTINQADRGFLLKHFEDGLALFDLQTLGVIKALAIGGVPDNMQVVARNDAFTKALSEAADDESLLYTTVAIKREEPKKEPKADPAPEPRTDVAVERKLEPKSDMVAVVDTGATKAGAEKPVVETAKAEEKPLKEEPKGDTPVATAPAKPEEVKKEEVKAEETKTGVAKVEDVKKDTIASQPQQPLEAGVQPQEPKKKEPVAEPVAEYKRSLVSKRSESSTTEGFGLVFFDQHTEGVDTIRLLIPNPKKPFVEEAVAKEAPAPKVEEPAKEDLQAKAENKEVPVKPEETAKADEAKKSEAQKEEVSAVADPGKADDTDKRTRRKTFKEMLAEQFKAPQQAAPEVKVENSACTALASEKDFLKVRKNMAAESNDEAMIEEAKVYFRSRCFSTEQIRNLSSLFLTSAAKYQFYDAAYKYVTDPSAFPSLESEIKDPYYLKRFKALIGQ